MTSGMPYDFTGKVVFVTGGASGIGRATALAFAEAGAWVVIADINDDGGLQTVRLIQESGGEGLFFKCDFASLNSIEHVMQSVIKHTGKIDCAFNNAGIEGDSDTTADCKVENWHRVIDVNLRGVWLCMKYEIAAMLKQGSGSIVNCSSVAGLVGFAKSPAYVASKHGVLGLTKTAALEYARQNIRVNAVCPGIIQTPMIDRVTYQKEDLRRQLADSEPMGRMGTPEEIAAAVLWLSSSQASFVTGQTLAVDGGWVAQ